MQLDQQHVAIQSNLLVISTIEQCFEKVTENETIKNKCL